MDDKKIAVIIHSADENIFQDAVKNFQTLQVPENFSVEFIQAQGDKNFQAFNVAMKKSDAKYKIYLDEKSTLLQKNTLLKVIETFQADENISVVGLSGAVQLSTHGICLTSAKRVGKIFFGTQKIFSDFTDNTKNFVEVEAVDNFFLATQIDIDWREDLFADNYFGYAAQCLEFKRRNLKTVVILDDAPQIKFDATNFSIDEQTQKVFLEEYKNIFPLVSVIIPTFNRPKFFQEALESVLNQTYRNFEIFISDNSTNDDTENLMQDYLQKYSNIKYFHHKNFDAHDNWNFARKYNNSDAEFVQWLMDDDRLLTKKFEVMVEIFRNNLDVSLVTSVRKNIDDAGNFIGDNRLKVNGNTKISGNEAGKLLLTIDDYIGVPSNALIRKNCLRNNDLCWNEDETGFYSLVDVSTWLKLLSKGNLYYCVDYLSETRLHSNSASNWIYTPLITSIDFAKMLKSAWERNIFLQTERDFKIALMYWLSVSARRLQIAYNENYTGEEVEALEKTFIAMSNTLINGCKIVLPEIKYSEQDKIKKLF